MICEPCKSQNHCNSNSCTCQHKEAERLPDGTVAPKGVKKDVR